MKIRNVLYVFLMIIFIVLAYFLIDRGINAKTKVYVNYKDNNDITYKVYLNDNSYLGMNNRYNTSLVNKINFDYSFKSVFNTNVNGFYSYNVEGLLVVYTDNINDSLLQKKYILLEDTVNTLNNNEKIIKLDNNIDIDYIKFRKELSNISKEYNTLVNGYLELRFNIKESLNFSGIEKTKEDSKQMKVIIPLSYDYFKINVIKNDDKIDSYYDFSKKQPVNYLLMILGALSLSSGISFLALVIREMVITYKKESAYNKELRKILGAYNDIIINIKKFYNKKKYNLIYVDSFKELLEVYDKVENPISFREIKKNSKAIFVLIDDDSAWIYELSSDSMK